MFPDASNHPSWAKPIYACYDRFRSVEGDAAAGRRALLARPQRPAAPNRDHLNIYAIRAGGAERQFCRLARALTLQGRDVSASLTYPPADDARHYTDMLSACGVTAQAFPHPTRGGAELAAWAMERLDRDEQAALGKMPPGLLHAVLACWRRLDSAPPQRAISFLESANYHSALAGLLAGTPRIVMVGRSLNPTCFPHLSDENAAFWAPLYRLLLSNNRVVMLNNSRAGACSYEKWLGLPKGTVGLLPNIVEDEAVRDRSAARRVLGLPEGAPVLAGVFRLSEEKRPLLFLDAAAAVKARAPHLWTVIAGDGPMTLKVRSHAHALGLAPQLMMTGAVSNPEDVMAASDVVMLTSRAEGTPNVLLEAQLQETPVIAPPVGGVPECVAPDLRPFLAEDAGGLAGGCLSLLSDPENARALGRAARIFVLNEFSASRALGAL